MIYDVHLEEGIQLQHSMAKFNKSKSEKKANIYLLPTDLR